MKYHFEATAKVIKSYRQKTSLSQSDLSVQLGYRNGQFISNVERGLCSIPLKKLKVVCHILAIPHDEMKEALLKDYSTDIDTALVYGETHEQILSVHSQTTGSGQATGQTLPA